MKIDFDKALSADTPFAFFGIIILFISIFLFALVFFPALLIGTPFLIAYLLYKNGYITF